MNEKKEYYTVKEVSKLVGLTPQSIRRRLTTITTTKDLLFRLDGTWYIHQLILYKFKRKRITNEFAYSLDFPSTYTNEDIDTILTYIVNDFGSDTITIDYTIEKKKKNGAPHIHAVVNTSNKRLFEKKVKILLGGNSYHIQAIYNKNKWLEYITKEVATITRKTNIKL
jgi:hypothetical protein